MFPELYFPFASRSPMRGIAAPLPGDWGGAEHLPMGLEGDPPGRKASASLFLLALVGAEHLGQEALAGRLGVAVGHFGVQQLPDQGCLLS